MSPYQTLGLKELHDKFCAEAEFLTGLSPRTIEWYRYGLKNLLRFKVFTHCSQLTELELSAFLFWGKKERNWCAKTMRGNYNSLSSFLAWCVRKGVLEENPIKQVPCPKLPQRLPKALAQKEARQLFECVQLMPVPDALQAKQFYKRRNVALFALLLFTGLRRQELLDLKTEAVNFDEDLISVRSGKGMKDRVVPMSFELKRYLLRYVEERDRCGIISPYFFTSPGRLGKLGVSTLTRLFRRIRDLSGIKFSPHQLRHTFATLMIQSKCDIYSLSKMMGHTDIRTTSIYLSASTDHMKAQVNNHPMNFV